MRTEDPELVAALDAALDAVVGASPWLADVCATDPLARVVLAHLDEPVPEFPPGDPYADIRRRKQLGVLRIAARDLLGWDDVAAVGARLADLADSLIADALAETPASSSGLAVIALGKLGAGELNYASDVDIVLVAGDGGADARPFLELARAAWRVDLGLRPEGRSGAVVRTLDSYRAYWSRWAESWEFQALLKARAAAGDARLAAAFTAEAAAQVWGRAFGDEDLRRLRRLKARSEAEVARRGLADREIKRGRGGIRDIEFAVQLLQLVHGRHDPALRAPATLDALDALAGGGYVAPDDAAALGDAYRFLRTVEHRLQLYRGQQAHTLPGARERRRHLALTMGYRDSGVTSAEQAFEEDLRRHRAAARSIHERLYFRPLLEAFTSGHVPGDPAVPPALGDEAVAARLTAFGFADPARTAQAVAELTRGFTRVSQLMQRMLPLLLDWLSASPDPDQGLLGLRVLAGAPPSRDQLVALCRESPAGARQLCHLLGTGPRFARDLQRRPASLAGLASGAFLEERTAAELAAQARLSLAWRSGEGAIESGLRRYAQGERLRIAARDVLGIDDPEDTGRALSDLADAVISAAVAHLDPPFPYAVIGLGRLGGGEVAYASDVDLVVVWAAAPENRERREGAGPAGGAAGPAAEQAEAVTAGLLRLIGGSSPSTGAYRVDLKLRPEGRQGALARSLESYAAYYERWARPWERQALLRARHVAGDADLGAAFVDLAARQSTGRALAAEDVVEIRRTKARMERERIPSGEDPKYHLKLGPGAITDVEWTVQLLQLRHRVPEARTLAALDALQERGVVAPGDAEVLAAAYRWCTATRNRLYLIGDVPSDSLPVTGPKLTALARSLGRTPSELRNEYTRVTRRARRVMERLFYSA